MERLTRKTFCGDYASAKNKVMFEHQEEYNKLGRFEDAEEQGRIIILPDTIPDDMRLKLRDTITKLVETEAVGFICTIL